jgi:hypothetical protein
VLFRSTRIYEEHGENVHLKVYTDETWLVETLQQYNGADKEHGMYKFHQIDHVRTERLASATNLRAAVRAGDKAAFYKDMGIKPSVTVRVDDRDLPVFEVVAHYLNMYPEKTKKAAVAEGSGGKAGSGGTKTIDKEKKAAMKNATTLPGLNMATGSMYKNYRMGIALAGAPNFPAGTEADNWIGGDPLISSYTEEEYEMVKAAAKQVGAGKLQNWSGDRSKEIADVNKISTVAKIKKNKYGI